MIFTNYFLLISHVLPQFDSEFHIGTHLDPEHKLMNKTNFYSSEEDGQ